MKLSDFAMEKDQETSYDEVIKDINGLAYWAEARKEDDRFEARKLITAKCKQLMRLLNDDDSEII